jgi:hypothetical protein
MTALAFNVGGTPNSATMNSFTISAQLTAATSLTGFITSGWTTCYLGNVVAVAGWNTYTFSAPFYWDGTSSVVFKVCFNNAAYSSNSHVYYSSTPASGAHYYWYNDLSSSSGCDITTASNYSYRPNVQITGEATAAPILAASPSTLAFGYIPFGSQSAAQTYVLSGGNLVASPVVVTAPAGFEVSLDGSSWAGSQNVTFTPPILPNTTIYVRFNPTVAGINFSGNVTNVCGAASANVAVTGTSDLMAAYCTSMANYIYDEEIYSVTINGATNAYDCFTVAPGPGSILNRYSNFHTLGSLKSLPRGSLIPFEVIEDECDGATYYSNGCAIWIDFNQDGDFTDPGEQVYSEAATTISPRTITGTFTVPPTATLGETGLRIVVAEGYSGATLTPCLTYGYGETEDYTVTIVQPPTGNLEGYVTNCLTSAPITGASVTIGALSTTTDGTGFYQILGIPTGTYDVLFEAANYVSSTATGVVINESTTTTLNQCLIPFGTLQGTVTDCFTSAAIEGAQVSFGTYSDLTDVTGFYSIQAPAGTYNVNFAKGGYNTVTVNGVVITSGGTTTQNQCLDELLIPPLNLQATVNLQDVHLTWSEPALIPDQWIQWDDGVNFNAIGTGGAADFDVASRWPVADIAPYGGTYLEQVRFFPYQAGATYTIKVWKGANASTLLYSQVVPSPVINAFNDVTLATPILIDGTDEFWFGYNVNTTAGYPAGCDNGPQIAGKGNMIYWSGAWYELTALNSTLTYNWNIAGFISATASPVMQPLIPFTQGGKKAVENTGSLSLGNFNMGTGSEYIGTPSKKEVIPQNPVKATVLGYNVYRNASPIATNVLGLTYDDLSVAPGEYDYTVRAIYPQGLSAPSNIAHATVLACQPVTNIKVLATGTGQVTIGWTQGIGTPTAWEIEYGLAGFTQGTGTVQGVSVNPQVTLTVTPGVLYDIYVRSVCNDGVYSPWAGPLTFRSHYFDCPIGSTPELEVCADTTNNGCNNVIPAFENIALGETKCGTAFFNGGTRDTDWYTFTLTQTTEVTLTGQADFDLLIGFIASPCPATVFIASATSSAGATATVTTTLAAGTYYAFAAPQFTNVFACGEADRYILTLTGNTCVKPTAASPVALNITGNSADIQWVPAGLETLWEYVIGVAPLPVPIGSGTATNVNPTPVSGLIGSTTYEFYVRADCGDGSFSGWAGPFSFSTLCGINAAPFAQNFEIPTFPPTCWSLASSNTYFWEYSNACSGYGTGSASAKANFYGYSSGTWDLVTFEYDASGLSIPTLSFDYAYATYSGEVDQMNVLYSTDNGLTYTLLLNMPGGSTGILNTGGTTTSVFVPTANQWATQTLALPAGTNKLKFQAISAYGNNLYVDNISVYDATPPIKTLNIKLLLEGLAQDRGLGAPPAGTMFEAYDEFGPHWGAGIADKVTVELRNSTTGALVYTISDIDLSTLGNVSGTVPAAHNGDYYLYLKHRNSITTSTANPVSFAGAAITYDFTIDAAQAFGSNMKVDGGYAYFFSGDENQDGIVDSTDLNDCDNDSAIFAAGYLATDVNGDGLVDSSDLNLIDNNNAAFVAAVLPF